MLSIRKSTTTAVTGEWARLLEGEDRLVAAQGFGAGVLVIGYADELLRHVDEEVRTRREVIVRSMVDRHLAWTDRTADIAAGRLGVVVVPLEGALDLARRARGIHADLRECGLHVDVAYSVRRRTGGLAAAAARADAALDNAVSRRGR